ncbi:hypothetical protein FA09DRAFT_332191 [Tilletiopsis washingtonensis]|uniref:SCP domain-containing protein n=1 Tax=Tilletiopsis washingtonensis TaxID=58919 RepID=A0A316Z2E8_9BASI|nr:hypothetical protein FA09DRAFT_332191 [Tilletiopsis washingtonensis]PWN95264.1 hypothetical protein FA09DRAFT_332191 [Tilletiopsis washingtonensis]
MRCSSIIAATVLLAGAAVSAQYADADHHDLAAREAAAAEWYARAAEEELAARHEAAWAARDYDDELLARAYMAAHDEELAARAAPKKAAAKSKSKASQHTFGWSGKGYKGGEQAHREFATACNAAAKRHDSNIYSLVVRDAGREKSRAYCYTFKGPQGQLHDHSAEIAGQLTWKKL